MAKKTQAFQLEDSISKLNEIVAKLESGDLSLDESLKLYEQGVSLSQQCKDYLDNAEQRILELGKKVKED